MHQCKLGSEAKYRSQFANSHSIDVRIAMNSAVDLAALVRGSVARQICAVVVALVMSLGTWATDALSDDVGTGKNPMNGRQAATASVPPGEMLRSQPEPNCDWGAITAATTRSNPPRSEPVIAHQKLEYERQCFRQYEIQARYRLAALQDWVRNRRYGSNISSSQRIRRSVAGARLRRTSPIRASGRKTAPLATASRSSASRALAGRSQTANLSRTGGATSWTATFYSRN
jgi:hypothetical protein